MVETSLIPKLSKPLTRPGATRKVGPKKTKPAPPKPPVMELGDAVEAALRTVGITKERVSTWLGRPCKCPERQEMLNRLSRWARRVLAGQTEDAEKYLNDIINEELNEPGEVDEPNEITSIEEIPLK